MTPPEQLNFGRVSVAVLGDVILDEYVYGRVSRISPEAPVPVLEVQSRAESLGGAGNVARNIAALGGRAALFSVTGRDRAAERFRTLAQADGVDTWGLLEDPSRPTTHKQRVAALTQQIVRIDSEVTSPVAPDVTEALARAMEDAARRFDVLVISDYDKGVLTADLLARSIAAFRAAGKPIVVDPNVLHFFQYGDATVVTPNHLQLERVSGRRIRGEEELLEVGFATQDRLKHAALLITRGEAGMALIPARPASGAAAGREIVRIPTVAREVYDVTGAGDTVVAVLALGLALGRPLAQAAQIANAAAGIVVGKRGTAVVTPAELAARLTELHLTTVAPASSPAPA